jgi:nucleoside-diphosphate-sugar epimerase
MRVVVCGAGGFIGGHLVKTLRNQGGFEVRAVDLKAPENWFQRFDDVENLRLDLRDLDACHRALVGADQVFNLAANMGGIGFIETNRADCMLSVLINTHLLMAARQAGVGRYFYASSACVYDIRKQNDSNSSALRESDAYPAMPEDGYGWEKLFSERMCRHFREDFGLEIRVARYHNVYGPFGEWRGGREKAPAAICRKVVEAKRSKNHEILIWGDGTQTRSFLFIDDCVKGTLDIMASEVVTPLNLGSSELVSINELVDVVESIAGVKLVRQYDLNAPQGVRGRNSDNTMIRDALKWEPAVQLYDGMKKTYEWIEQTMTVERTVS